MNANGKSLKREQLEREDYIQQEVRQPFLYVAIGASAGGLEAIEKFFTRIPHDSDLAFFVIQHLSPDHKSIMPELTKKWTHMAVHRVEDGMEVLPNNVYLIPPKKEMTIFNGKLLLNDYSKDSVLHLPIDTFFRSLAQDQGKNSIGIILSGTGSDGTLGIKAIKEAGGTVLVQDPRDAKFDGMPKNAISTGMVEMILPADEIPQQIMDFITHPYHIYSNKEDSDHKKEKSTLQKILYLLKEESEVDFTMYKSSTIIRRIERRISLAKTQNLEDYYENLRTNFGELQKLYSDLLIGVTQFFRDTEAWDIVKNKVVPEIIDKKKDGDSLRVWSAGCSTGEEAYSLAMLIYDYCDKKNKHLNIKIFATDLDKDALERAGLGIYPESIVADVKPELLRKHFRHKNNGNYQVSEKIRRMVIFATHNILTDPPFSKVDFITCRNMLIYLQAEHQKKILNMFYYSTLPKGFIFLGSSETLNHLENKFDPIDPKWKVFQYKDSASNKNRINEIYDINLPEGLNRTQTNAKKMFVKKSAEVPGEIFTKILNEHLLNGFLVDDNHIIQHIFGDAKNYVSIPNGRANWDLFNVIDKGLYTVITSLYHKVKKEKSNAHLKRFNFVKDNNSEILDIYTKSISYNDEYFYLIYFQPAAENRIEKHTDTVTLDIEMESRVETLERELKNREESLHTTIEELETSNEELQASNEELVSANEELQSTNEELQSVNEELYTVNSEFQKKIGELTTLNNDIKNLLDNTNIGSLYLDSRLNIRRFTSGIDKVLNILDVDMGRPLSHISTKTNYNRLFEDATQVIEDLQPVRREIEDEEGNWYEIRIKPYRESDNSIHGLIIILDDISDLKSAIHELQELKDLYTEVTNNVDGTDFYLFDDNCKIILAEGSGTDKWGFIKTEFEGKYLQEIIDKESFSIVEPVYRNALNGKVSETEFKYKSEWYRVKAFPVYKNGKVIRGLAVYESMQYLKLVQQKCKINKNYNQFLLDQLNYPAFLLDSDFEIQYSNKPAKEIFKLIGKKNTLADIPVTSNQKKISEILKPLVIKGKAKDNVKISIDSDSDQTNYLLSFYPQFDLNKEVDSFLILFKN